MKLMVIVKATKRYEAGLPLDEKSLSELKSYNELLTKEGILVSKEELLPSSKGVRMQFNGPEPVVSNGPFTELNELVAAYWIWRVKSMDEALDWAKRCPSSKSTDFALELRPMLDGESPVPAAVNVSNLHEKEAAKRAEALGLGSPKFENGHELLIAGMNQSYMFVSRVHIPSQWQRFMPQVGRIPGRVGQTTYGVCSTFRSDGGFEYLSGVEVSQTDGIPADFSTVKLPGQRYAVFTHSDHVSSIAKTIDTIWNKWFPESGLKHVEAPCFERYTEAFNPQTGMGGMEIWIPIQK